MSISISKDVYLETTIKTCETTLSLLNTYKSQNRQFVDNAIQSLEQFIESSSLLLTDDSQGILTSSKRNKTKIFTPPKVNSNWKSIDEKTVHVILPNEKIIICKLVTTDQELKEAIDEVLKAKRVCIDCEFLGVKKGSPLLKVLQLAVSKYLGFAILVDYFDNSFLKDSLRDVLQRNDIERYGWAVRADAQAIEETVRIEMDVVLDLQSKVYADAVDTMNLASAMTKYASSWEGYDDFMAAKNLSTSFSFREQDCVWLKQPLPMTGIIYAVFDVVSLFSLLENTNYIETKEEYYWPHNILKDGFTKASNKWLNTRRQTLSQGNDMDDQQSEINNNNNNNNNTNINNNNNNNNNNTNINNKNNNNNNNYNNKPTDNIYNDDNIVFKANLEKARLASLKEHSKSQASTSSSASAPGSVFRTDSLLHVNNDFKKKSASSSNKNVIKDDQFEVYEFDNFENNAPSDGASLTGNIHFSETIDEPPNKKLDYKVLEPEEWGEPDPNSASYGGGWGNDEFIPTQQSEPKQKDNNNNKEEGGWVPTTMDVDNKPKSIVKHQDWGIAYTNRNTGAFSTTPYSHSDAGWNSFVEKSRSGWETGVDSSMHEYDEGVKKLVGNTNNYRTSSTTSTHSTTTTEAARQSMKSTTRKFNTTVTPLPVYQLNDQNGWDMEEEQPVTMIIPLTGTKYKGKLNGPKINNVHDDEIETEDDSDSDIDDDDKDTYKEYYEVSKGTAYELHLIKQYEQLDMMDIQPKDHNKLELAIVAHFQPSNQQQRSSNNSLSPKALSLTLNNDKEYLIILDKVCFGNSLINTKLRYLLVNPAVTRISFRLTTFKKELEKKLGFDLGQTIDILHMIPRDHIKKDYNFTVLINKFLNDWDGLERYNEMKQAMNEISQKKLFTGTIWDRDKIPVETISYSAAQGALFFALYKKLLNSGSSFN